jgi:hypothetical protein
MSALQSTSDVATQESRSSRDEDVSQSIRCHRLGRVSEDVV